MHLVERAITIAVEAHRGQVDKAGEVYILHPLRLMTQMTTDEERMVAVLHDVVEDSEYSLEDLTKAGFPPSVIAAIDCVTKRDGEAYDAFIERIAKNQLATRIKLADMKDNADLTRLPQVTEEDRVRVQKYRTAIARLETALHSH